MINGSIVHISKGIFHSENAYKLPNTGPMSEHDHAFANHNVRSNTHYVYRVITPSAICPHNRRLCPLERYKRQCGDHTVGVELEILDSKGTGRCC